MTTIIQDYKDYRKAKKNVELAADKVNDKFQEILQPISLSELNKYHCELGVLTINAKAVYDGKNKQEFIKYMNENAHLVRLPSCFCDVLAAPYMKPNSILEHIIFSDFAKKERAKCTEDNVIRCVHNREDGVFYEHYCADCSPETFGNLLDYQCLKADLQDAEQNLATAKQKLRDRLPFARQK